MLNVIVLMGRLTRNPELKVTTSGVSVTTFDIAVDRNYTKGAEKKTDFFTVTAWRNTAEFICKYFHKGEMIAVQGSLQTGSYTGKDGKSHKTYEVVASNVSFCGDFHNGANPGTVAPGSVGSAGASSSTAADHSAASASGPEPEDDEIYGDGSDLPF